MEDGILPLTPLVRDALLLARAQGLTDPTGEDNVSPVAANSDIADCQAARCRVPRWLARERVKRVLTARNHQVAG
jgi:hypothetical protein